MKQKSILISRALLGLIFFVFGLNGFLQFLPMPPLPEKAAAFMAALADAGYLFPLIKGVEVVGGLLLLTHLWTPLALILLAPIVVNIFFFHLVLEPAGLPIGILLVLLEIFLAWSYRERFAPLLKMK